MAQDNPRAFPDLRISPRDPKPRTRGLTEIRGPYYTVMGPHYLADVLDTMGPMWIPSNSPAGRLP